MTEDAEGSSPTWKVPSLILSGDKWYLFKQITNCCNFTQNLFISMCKETA